MRSIASTPPTHFNPIQPTNELHSNQPLDDNIMDDADLAGPLFFLLAFGVFLLLTGKVRKKEKKRREKKGHTHRHSL
jgi:hypothetical protein